MLCVLQSGIIDHFSLFYCSTLFALRRLIISQTSGNWNWKALIGWKHVPIPHLRSLRSIISFRELEPNLGVQQPPDMIWIRLVRSIVIIISNKWYYTIPNVVRCLLHINWIKKREKKICKLLHSDAIMTSGSGVAILQKVWFPQPSLLYFQTLLFYNSYLITVSKVVCGLDTKKKESRT